MQPIVQNLQRDFPSAFLSAIDKDRWINGNCSVSARVESNCIIVEGKCSVLSAKRRSVALAELLGHGRIVVDRVRRNNGVTRDYDWLASSVAERLCNETEFKDYYIGLSKVTGYIESGPRGPVVIQVAARDGAVSLTGLVRNINHRRLAEVLAWWTPGCTFVENRLKIRSRRTDSNEALNEAVLMALSRDPLIGTQQLHCSTAAGIVHLEGVVAGERERLRVIEDIWTVPGVWDIEDHLQMDRY